MDALVKPLRLLREGRSSELWLVSLEGLGKAAIEKRFRPDVVGDPAALYSALRTAAEARDESLIRTFDIDLSDKIVRLWMEHVPGESLSSALVRVRRADEVLPLPIAGRIVAEAARGLHRAHEHGRVSGREPMFVHGAMSARSVLLGLGGEVKVLELGAGRVVLRAAESIGLQLHLAPELAQARGFDRRADVFALGVMMRELTLGVRLPQALSAAIERATSRFPESRFSTAEDFAEAVRDAIGDLADRTMLGTWFTRLVTESDTQPNRAMVSIPAPAETAIGAMHDGTVNTQAVALGEFEETMRPPPAGNEHAETVRPPPLDGADDDELMTARRMSRAFESVDSTDPSNAAVFFDQGTSTQDRVELDHTISREVSASGSGAIKVKEERAERRGRLKKRRSLRGLMWALAAACLPLIALIGFMVRSRFLAEGSVRRAVSVDTAGFDRAVPLSVRVPEVPLFWGRVEPPPRLAVSRETREARPRGGRREAVQPSQSTQPVQVTQPAVSRPVETKTVETKPAETKPAESKPAIADAPATGRVNVSVLRGGRSSQMLVFVDGKPLLRSPSSIQLAPGAHDLEIRPKGKAPITRRVEVKAGAAIDVALDLGDDADDSF